MNDVTEHLSRYKQIDQFMKGEFMRATTKNRETGLPKAAITINELADMLSCGTNSARKIGLAAGAHIKIGSRSLWNVNRVKMYLDQISSAEE